MADFNSAKCHYISRRFLKLEIVDKDTKDFGENDRIAVLIRYYGKPNEPGAKVTSFKLGEGSFSKTENIINLETYVLHQFISDDGIKINNQCRVYVAKVNKDTNVNNIANERWTEALSATSGIPPTFQPFPHTRPVITCFGNNCFKIKHKVESGLSNAYAYLKNVVCKITTINKNTEYGNFQIAGGSGFPTLSNAEILRFYKLYEKAPKLVESGQYRVYLAYVSDNEIKDGAWKQENSTIPWIEVFSESSRSPTIKNVPSTIQIKKFSKTFIDGTFKDARLDSVDYQYLNFAVRIKNYEDKNVLCNFGIPTAGINTEKGTFNLYNLYDYAGSDKLSYNTKYGFYMTLINDDEWQSKEYIPWKDVRTSKGEKPTLSESVPKNINIKAFGPSFLRIDFEHTREEKHYDEIRLRILDGRTTGKKITGLTLSSSQAKNGIRGYFPIDKIENLKIGTKYYLQLAYVKKGSATPDDKDLEWEGTGEETTFHSTAPKISRVLGLTTERIGVALGSDSYRASGDFYNYFIRVTKGTTHQYFYTVPGTVSQADRGKNVAYSPVEVYSSKYLYYGPGSINVEENQKYQVSVAYGTKNQFTNNVANFKESDITLEKIAALEYGTPVESKLVVEKAIENQASGVAIDICSQGRLKFRFSNLPANLDIVDKIGIRILTNDGQKVITKFTTKSFSVVNGSNPDVSTCGLVDYQDSAILGVMTSGLSYKIQITYCTQGETAADLVQDRVKMGFNGWSESRIMVCLTPEIVYAPVLDTRIPAMSENRLSIPFTHNPAVSLNEIHQFKVLIKNPADSKVVLSFVTTTNRSQIESMIANQCIEYTDNTQLSKLELNKIYKIQIAYVANGQPPSTLRYSTAAMCNFVAIPSVVIRNGHQTQYLATETTPQYNFNIYTGMYDTATPSEVVYEYKFSLYQGTALLETTGWKLHNSSTDNLYIKNSQYRKTCFDYYERLYELDPSVSYTLEYSIRTVNDYKESCVQLIQPTSYSQNDQTDNYTIQIGQTPEAYENGYLDIQLGYKYLGEDGIWHNVQSKDSFEDQSVNLRNGNFVLRRTDSESDFKIWSNIINFSLQNADWDKDLHWIDATIEHGKTYKYALSRIANSTKEPISWVESNEYTPFFEHMYLSDNERQLCLKFNPQISSLKRTVQEQKTDTLGGKYPIFFRNGDMYYTEIPISGLISYLSDENGLYTTVSNSLNTTNLTDQNILTERLFKISVLDWLNNGRAKYFRSPTEGNFIIRALNVSMSPEQTLGRLLHSVSCTGYEVADNNVTNLINNQTFFVQKSKEEERANI